MLSEIALIVLTLPAVLSSLIGYDCGGEGLNITTLSLLDLATCGLEDLEPQKTEIHVQLMQVSDYDKTHAMQCRMEIDRIVYHCGMHSHVSVVNNGRRTYVRELGADMCRRIQETRSVMLGSTIIDKLSGNVTNWRSVTLAGRAAADGTCQGASYTDELGSWDSVVVQASVRVTLRTFDVTIKRSTNEVILPSGVRCEASTRVCMDEDGAETYWTATQEDSCHFNRYDILYEGPAIKLYPTTSQASPVMYTVTTGDTTFALIKTREFSLCGYQLSQTEHPKLIVFEMQHGRTFKTRSHVLVDNLDIFSYVNSKFVYVEKHLKTQVTQLYKDIMEQKCALERQILQNVLSYSGVAPDEMAYRIMKTPGYTAVIAGEVIHLIKCMPVDCRIRHTETCFNELPVTFRNASYFLLPRSRILTKVGTTKDCNELLPTMYRLHETWFRITTRPIETATPPAIQPLTRPKWKYVSPDALATSGIYTAEDLTRLRMHIMFPVEKPSTLNTIARGAMGQTIPSGSVSLMNLLDEQSINRIAESAGKRAWQGFVTFGSASAGVLAIFVILRLTKLVIDTIIHGYALHSVYGWSVHLLAAIWSSVTNLLLHLGRPDQPQRPQGNRDYILDTETPWFRPLPESTLPTAPSGTEDEGKGVSCDRSYSELRKLLNEVK